MSQKKIKILKSMAKFAHQKRPDLSEKRAFGQFKRVYNRLDSETKSRIKGLTIK